jgi:ribosome biogenesis protein MAK21
MYLNLLYKSLKADLNVKRVKAFIKRLLQVLTLHDPPFVCSAIYLVCEMQKVFPSLGAMLNEPEHLEDDEEEHFVDAPEDGEENEAAEKAAALPSTVYDPRKRDPLFSNADRSCLWELLPLQAHFHPSVALFASRLLFGQKMPEKPDPTLHTLMHFLDRFAYRNVRAKGPVVRGVSIMQPLAGAAGTDILIRDRSGARIETPLNTEGFWDKHRDQVKPDEVFFHQYFNQAGKKKVKGGLKDEDEAEELDEEENEDQIWKALAESRPEIEGEDEDEMGFSDMDDLMSGDDVGDDMEEEEEEDDDEDGGVIINLGSDEEDAEEGGAKEEEGDDEDSEMDFDIAELESGEDGLIGSDEDIPSDIELPPMAQVDDEEDSNKSRRQKKRKLKHLPVFASAEDYAELIGNDEEEAY